MSLGRTIRPTTTKRGVRVDKVTHVPNPAAEGGEGESRPMTDDPPDYDGDDFPCDCDNKDPDIGRTMAVCRTCGGICCATVEDFCNHVGISPVARALRAIDKHNIEHVWIVLIDGTRVYYHSDLAEQLKPEDYIRGVGVGGIAWDGSDWEWSDEVDIVTANDWEKLEELRTSFSDALLDWESLSEDDEGHNPQNS